MSFFAFCILGEMPSSTAVIGIVVGVTGGFLVLFGLGIGLYCYIRRRKKIEEPERATWMMPDLPDNLPLSDVKAPEMEKLREKHHQSHPLPTLREMGPVPDGRPSKHPVDYKVPDNKKSVSKHRFSKSRESDSSAVLNVTFDDVASSYTIPPD